MPKQPDPAKLRAQAAAIAARIVAQLAGRINTGIESAAVFITARLKEELSVPAPRKRVVDRFGDIEYRATTRAIPGAPPRKLSGKLRQSVTYLLDKPVGAVGKKLKASRAVIGVKARSKTGFNYPRALELSPSLNHPFMVPTIRKWRKELVAIVGRSIVVRVR